MNKKTLVTLEYNKIIDHLISFSDFSTSAELAQSLLPTNDLAEARSRQVATREARLLLDLDDSISFNGAVDLKPLVSLAQHDGVLEPINLLSIKQTLIISRSARRVFDEHSEMVPGLSALAEGLSEGLGLIDSISRAISDRGEVLDSASDALGRIRSELKITYERLISRLQKY